MELNTLFLIIDLYGVDVACHILEKSVDVKPVYVRELVIHGADPKWAAKMINNRSTGEYRGWLAYWLVREHGLSVSWAMKVIETSPMKSENAVCLCHDCGAYRAWAQSVIKNDMGDPTERWNMAQLMVRDGRSDPAWLKTL